jgi:hypothetical protein
MNKFKTGFPKGMTKEQLHEKGKEMSTALAHILTECGATAKGPLTDVHIDENPVN